MKTIQQLRDETLLQNLDEGFINMLPHHTELRDKHFPHIFNMVHAAYAGIGGIKGSGFDSVEDMKKNIHMVKAHTHQGQIKAVALYKDKAGRKAVATATDGSEEGKRGLAQMGKADMKTCRAWKEVSSKSLSFMKKNVNVGDFALHPHEVQKLLPHDKIEHPVPDDDPEVQRHPELKNHFYRREIGGEVHTKIAVGTPHKNFF